MNILLPLIVIVAIAIVGVFILGFSASLVGYGLLKTTAKFGSSAAASAAQAPKQWSNLYGYNVPATFPIDANGNTYIDFPPKDGVHYVIKAAPTGVALGQTITMDFAISGDGTLAVADPGDILPATVRLHLEGSAGVNDRWFQHVGTNLTDGDQTVSCQLNADNFGGVGGGVSQPTDFATAVRNLRSVGFTFGGQYFAGHGVYATNGSKRFTLKNFTIQ